MTNVNPASEVKKALESSELISSLKSASSAPQGRALTEDELSILKSNGNYAENWDNVQVSEDFNPNRIAGSSFFGKIYLGNFKANHTVDGAEIGGGVYASTITNSVIEDDVFIKDVSNLSNYVVKKGAVLLNLGTVAVTGETSFGNGGEIPIAIETGGREVLTYSELTVDVAEKVAGSRADKALLEEYAKAISEYTKAATSSVGVIEEGAEVKNTQRILNTFVGKSAEIDGATLIKESTILSNKEEATDISDGSYVKNSLIQWGCEVTSMAIVANSVLTEHSHVERHGKVTDSIVGANTGIAEGEVTACLVGPFVGFHHQSLLIAAYWPEGKGNIGYGANVGSNHTSKAPDQEIWCGEGTFFGLGVNIKFPSDFTKSPYSIIATAVNALPQNVAFPFSLINTPAAFHDGISPAFNEIIPGWVLSDNIFTVRRNEGKYKKRNKAKRSNIVFEVFRPDIVDLMLDARARLEAVTETKDVYTSRDVKGLGKNFMSETSRQKAIESYTFYIQYYGLMGLKKKVEELGKGNGLLGESTDDARWEHERSVLNKEFPNSDIKDLLSKLIEMQEKIAQDVQVSKEKDDVRGARTIADYPEAHAPAASDSFVKQTHEETAELKKEITALISKI